MVTSSRPLPQNRWDLLEGIRPEEPPTVTVVVPHFRQQDELDRTLFALSRQDHPGSRLEIVVVDDGSPTPPRVPEGVLLLAQEDRGFRVAAARNAGAAVASGEVLCFLDADTAPEPTYIRELTRLPALSSDTVTVGRRRHAAFAENGVPLDEPVEIAGPGLELPEPQWLGDAYRATRNLLDADDRGYRYVIGAVSACSAALFRETGGFDEGFDRYGGEDWEWTYRAWLLGALLAHVPSATAWHDGPEWADRDDASLEQKNAEALRLARLVPVPGSAPLGTRGDYADVAVTLNPSMSDAASFVTLDSVAADLPLAALPGDSRSLERCRFEVTVLHPIRIRPGALRGLVERAAREAIGTVDVVSDDGESLMRVTSMRARARIERWGDPTLFPHRTETVPGITALPESPDVEAYLGGWA